LAFAPPLFPFTAPLLALTAALLALPALLHPLSGTHLARVAGRPAPLLDALTAVLDPLATPFAAITMVFFLRSASFV
jgi:hypothetical protein